MQREMPLDKARIHYKKVIDDLNDQTFRAMVELFVYIKNNSPSIDAAKDIFRLGLTVEKQLKDMGNEEAAKRAKLKLAVDTLEGETLKVFTELVDNVSKHCDDLEEANTMFEAGYFVQKILGIAAARFFRNTQMVKVDSLLNALELVNHNVKIEKQKAEDAKTIN